MSGNETEILLAIQKDGLALLDAMDKVIATVFALHHNQIYYVFDRLVYILLP